MRVRWFVLSLLYLLILAGHKNRLMLDFEIRKLNSTAAYNFTWQYNIVVVSHSKIKIRATELILIFPYKIFRKNIIPAYIKKFELVSTLVFFISIAM